ncbi:hypothetical protein, partial [Pseudomonas nitroreducens]
AILLAAASMQRGWSLNLRRLAWR